MKLTAHDRVHERITAIGIAAFPTYIVRGDEKSVMIDSGVNLLGPTYLADIKGLFGDAGGPDYLLLTHSHYDHAGSAGYLKRQLPHLRVGAHERVAALVKKPSVIETFNRMSANHVELEQYNAAGEDVAVRPFDIDLLLKQGDELDLGNLSCVVHETPGHTRDCLAFHFPEIGALLPGDCCGVLRAGTPPFIQVEFVASYWDYVGSLKRMAALKPHVLCLGHNWVLTGKDAPGFLETSLAQTFRYKETAEGFLRAAGGDVEAAVQMLLEAEMGPGRAAKAPAAYVTNTMARFKHLAEQSGP